MFGQRYFYPIRFPYFDNTNNGLLERSLSQGEQDGFTSIRHNIITLEQQVFLPAYFSVDDQDE